MRESRIHLLRSVLGWRRKLWKGIAVEECIMGMDTDTSIWTLHLGIHMITLDHTFHRLSILTRRLVLNHHRAERSGPPDMVVIRRLLEGIR